MQIMSQAVVWSDASRVGGMDSRDDAFARNFSIAAKWRHQGRTAHTLKFGRAPVMTLRR